MDIVERLREGKSAGGYWREKEAADEIERLRDGPAMNDFIGDVIFPIVAIVLGFILFCYVCVWVVSPSKEDKMYQHCIDDGIKDYVCYQMTHVSAKYIPIPMN